LMTLTSWTSWPSSARATARTGEALLPGVN
jgi:hypothetical protein